MLRWLARGLTQRRVTTRYPRAAEPAPRGYQGRIEVTNLPGAERTLAAVCPTGAITITTGGMVGLDRGRCILCGACVRAAPERFAFQAAYETASTRRSALLVGDHAEDDVVVLRRALGDQARALRRSIHVRHVDAGSDGSEEWEIAALTNPYYDIQRLGLYFTASPRHADILLVTGGVTEPMREPLARAWDVMPAPKALVAAGTDACSGGLSARTGQTLGGVDQLLPVDVYVPGSPPAPIGLLHGLLLAVGLLKERPT